MAAQLDLFADPEITLANAEIAADAAGPIVTLAALREAGVIALSEVVAATDNLDLLVTYWREIDRDPKTRLRSGQGYTNRRRLAVVTARIRTLRGQ